MPAGFTSAKFVGRESAFARFAPALEAAAAGVPTTVLVEGTGGVGVSRFLYRGDRPRDRARRSVHGPPRSGRARRRRRAVRADPPGDPPDAARGVGRRAGRPARPGHRGRPPAPPRAPHSAWAGPTGIFDHPTVTSPERRQARLLEGILGVLIRLGERHPVVLILEDLHHADAGTRAFATFLARVQRPRRVCLVASFQPDEVTRSHPLTAEIAAMTSRPQARPAPAARPARSRRAGRPDRGDRGRAPDRLGPRAGPGAQPRRAARRRGGAGREAGAVPRVAAGQLRGPRDRPARAPIAGVPADPPAARPCRPAADADRARRRRGGLRADGRPPPAAAVDEHAPPRRTARSTPTSPRDSPRPSSTGSSSSPTMASTSATSSSAGPSSRTCFRASAIATTSRSRPASSPTRRPRRATGARRTPHARRARPRSRRPAGRRRSTRPRTRSTISSSRSRRTCRRRPEPPREDALDAAPLQVRAAEAAFAAGRSARALAYVESVIASLDERTDRLEVGLLHERLGRYRRSVGDLDGALSALRRAVSLVPSEPSVERATVLAALAQVRMLDGTFSEAESLAREAIAVADCLGPRGPRPDGPRDDDARRVARLGRGSRGRRGAAARGARHGRGDGRPRRAVPGLRQPHDGPRSRRPARGGGRGRVRGRGGDPPGGPRGRVRQLPAGQRGRLALPARTLARVARAERDGARVEPGRRDVRELDRQPRGRRDRDPRGRVRGPAAGPAAARAGDRPRRPARDARSTARPPRSRCGATTTSTPGGRRSAAGSSSTTPRTGA